MNKICLDTSAINFLFADDAPEQGVAAVQARTQPAPKAIRERRKKTGRRLRRLRA